MIAPYDPWSTHVPALAAAVHRFGDHVLEIGAGWYSTPLLHAMSRNVRTVETSQEWVDKFKPIAPDQIHVVPDLMAAAKLLAEMKWDVVFVDCEGNHFRLWITDLFLEKECCVVAHDTQEDYWKPTLERVRYIRHFDFTLPRTSYLSNVLDVTV